MRQTLQVADDAEDAAHEAASLILLCGRRAEHENRPFTMAVSGGTSPGPMFTWLVSLGLPWDRTVIYQVDERVAPAGDPDRNLTDLQRRLADVPADIRPMPVEEPDLQAAAARYEASLPERFDVVHLGCGPDGHTASLIPGDPVLEVSDRLVAITGEYQGRRRMTLTYPALARADQLVWLVAGKDKRDALAKLLAGDRSVPAGRVEAKGSYVCADPPAAGLPARSNRQFD